MSVQEFFEYLAADDRSTELAQNLAAAYVVRCQPAARDFAKAS